MPRPGVMVAPGLHRDPQEGEGSVGNERACLSLEGQHQSSSRESQAPGGRPPWKQLPSTQAQGYKDVLQVLGTVLRVVRATPPGVQEEGQQMQMLSEGRWG